ncbi:HNH endonuclease [Propionivibrio dicarboxylicus]|uniref:Predicted restriction endonuclease, HNH family n=1 Tax=Propionivibrio dicarboxylicus TaxID=83767 RepID=A0A1G7WN19_9RHOO|nr:HNH endonuclease [Propionivibrio dicarboxylicus]SDG73405.1 Predicted restriction endonuclease, HNH family [Propionivibrio dicarboxylicus]
MKGQVFTVAKLHYINGVVYCVADLKGADIATLARHNDLTTKSGSAKHPAVRVRTLVRFAAGLGLLDATGDQVKTTDLGALFCAARTVDTWEMTDRQKEMLRHHLDENPQGTATLHSLSSLLRLVKGGLQGEDLVNAYASAIEKTGAWRSKVTSVGFTKFGLDYLKELGLIPGNEMLSRGATNGSGRGRSGDSEGDRKKRNPKWSRDELILALDLYLQQKQSPVAKDSKDVLELSSFLNRLGVALGVVQNEAYRNSNGVYMKLMNFRHHDPDYTQGGRVGLGRGNRDEAVVWQEFAASPARLAGVVRAIKAAVMEPSVSQTIELDEPGFVQAEEGAILTRLHRIRERSRKLIEGKKKAFRDAHGKLFCEACGFDFCDKYGATASHIIEVHHTKPLHTLEERAVTKLDDLAMLCPNCHRVVHSKKQWLTVSQVKDLIVSNVKN